MPDSKISDTPRTVAMFRDALQKAEAASKGTAKEVMVALLSTLYEQVKLMEREAEQACKDAKRWRKHEEIVQMSGIRGALRIRLTMTPEASNTNRVWEIEAIFDTRALGQTSVLGTRAIGLSVEQKAKELFAAIHTEQVAEALRDA